jgi:hypothetical protein
MTKFQVNPPKHHIFIQNQKNVMSALANLSDRYSNPDHSYKQIQSNGIDSYTLSYKGMEIINIQVQGAQISLTLLDNPSTHLPISKTELKSVEIWEFEIYQTLHKLLD